MAKFKIERDPVSGQTFLVVQGAKGQQISEREYYALRTGQIPRLLHADVIRKGNTFKLNYNISGYISLREYLLNPLNSMSFANLLTNILENLKALHQAYFNPNYVLMDLNAAMVNPSTQEVSLVYVPIPFYESDTNLKDFLLSIIQCCSFVPGENTDYVRDYINILNNGINFSIFDLEEYVKHLGGQHQTTDNVKRCPRCKTAIDPGAVFCFSCGAKVQGLGIPVEQGIYNPADNVVFAEDQNRYGSSELDTVPNGQAEASVMMDDKEDSFTTAQSLEELHSQPLSPPRDPWEQYRKAPVDAKPDVINVNREYQQTISDTSYNGSQVVQPVDTNVPEKRVVNATIKRLKTGEVIQLSPQGFRIGKDPFSNDYCVRDNTSVSRSHASIQAIDGVWYIRDQGSTNKTYVNGQPIVPNTDVPLYDGVSVRLSNESFIFYLF